METPSTMIEAARLLERSLASQEYECAITVRNEKTGATWVIANRPGKEKYNILRRALLAEHSVVESHNLGTLKDN